MIEKFEAFISKHDSFVISTHDPADADGLGAELTIALILQERKKKFRIINASPISSNYIFMDPSGIIEQYNETGQGMLPESTVLVLVDTADVNNMGCMREAALRSKEIFYIDHHEPKPDSDLSGIADPSAASTCEMAVELAHAAGVPFNLQTAIAAYAGIVYDTGFFAYSKTGPRAFKAALSLLDAGVDPSAVYHDLCESSPTGTLLLQKKSLDSLAFHCRGRVASQVLRKEDFTETDTQLENSEGFVNIPLKSKDILVSIMIKESPEGKVRCSMRSKGMINVAKIAQDFGGGGHVNASGFKRDRDINKTLAVTLEKISEILVGHET